MIKKNYHSNYRIPRILSNHKRLVYNISFTDSCRYDIGDAQDQINKLFGIGYFPYHRYNSVRFGWRYNKDKDVIDIFSYYYMDGLLYNDFICHVEFNKTFRYDIIIINDMHRLMVKGIAKNVPLRPRKLGYCLYPYFGGKVKAPHDIIINMKP